MGVHTGDSITVAPAMTLTDSEYQRLRDAARAVMTRDRRRDGRLERAVRGQSRERPHRRHRDEPARVAQLGARVEGHRVPDREDRREARGRLHARRAHQRHHRDERRLFEPTIDYVVVKWPRFAFEKFPGADDAPRHADEERRRGDGDRPHVPARRCRRRRARSRPAATGSSSARARRLPALAMRGAQRDCDGRAAEAAR